MVLINQNVKIVPDVTRPCFYKMDINDIITIDIYQDKISK